MRVDIISTVLNGAPYLPEFIESLQRQTHGDWTLWIRDDGSSDGSVEILRSRAAADSRVHVLGSNGQRLGIAAGFGAVLEQLPQHSAYIMCGDVDDVWLPTKIERMLPVMLEAERATPTDTPILVHSDLTVVDTNLNVRSPSFWRMAGFGVNSATFRRTIIRNVVTSSAIMFNAPLRIAIGRTPQHALYHDWWYALVCAAFGRLVAFDEPTALYRQHGANSVGAYADPTRSLGTIPRAIVRGLRSGPHYRGELQRTAAQAAAFLERYNDALTEPDREFLRRYAAIPRQRFLRRKLDVLRFRAPYENGVLRMLGAVLRG